ncbi:baeRF6 domain-containing protein [Levilactobacillus bambusae]|uniref:Bacterial archaeo-eukaryotic release factor family 6 domain-containing protein n=1 Tax=Levilactobacillus bambusae TaxID=2024736 RepID=A0A2V1N306_9LACO|nr:hypothetical protein [Levilactobacillus bambusae]PWG00546.1 hypothetical protein DCM90_06380 [Levilactobacillus bambusae]
MAATNVELQNALTLESDPGPFVSIFMPLNPKAQNRSEDASQFNSLISEAKREFTKDYSEKAWHPYADKIDLFISSDRVNSDRSASGLALYIGANTLHSFPLRDSVSSFYTISNTIQILPLIKDSQFSVEYDLLLLRRNTFQLFHIKDLIMEEIHLPEDAPTTMGKAVGTDLTGGRQRERSEGMGAGTHFAGRDQRDETKVDDRKHYFGIIDEYIFKNYSNVDHLPLIVAAVTEDQGVFRKQSKNLYLNRDIEITKIPSEHSQINELQEITSEIATDYAKADVAGLKTKYDNAVSSKRYATDLETLMDAAISGQVDTLFVTEGAYLAGKLTDDLHIDTNTPEGKRNNLLNDLAITVAGFGGQVYVLPKDETPARKDEPAVAILRARRTADKEPKD